MEHEVLGWDDRTTEHIIGRQLPAPQDVHHPELPQVGGTRGASKTSQNDSKHLGDRPVSKPEPTHTHNRKEGGIQRAQGEIEHYFVSSLNCATAIWQTDLRI